MRKVSYLLFFFTTSCATLLNKPHQDITIYAEHTNEKVIFNQDTLDFSQNQVLLRVARKNEPLEFTVLRDTGTNIITIEPKNSIQYWGNILQNGGIGLLVDRNDPRRYAYPANIYLDGPSKIGKPYKTNYMPEQGTLDLHISLPYFNLFLLQPEGETTKVNAGFWGLGIGINIYHTQGQYLHFGIVGATDFFLPIPAAVDLSGEIEWMSTRYITLSNNHSIKRFSLGYGIVYARNTWDLRYYDAFDPPPPTRPEVVKSENTFGLIFPTTYRWGKYFDIGLIYRPTFYRPQAIDKFVYEHLLSIDLSWKIILKK